MNDCVVPERLVPSLLVLCVMPRLTDLPRQIPSHIEHFKYLYKALREYEQFVIRQCIIIGLRRRMKPASSYCILPEDQIAVYRESLRELTGPYTTTSISGTEVLDFGQSTGPRSFNIAQIKPWTLRDKSYLLERPQLALLQEK
jgi:hypothetical protein